MRHLLGSGGITLRQLGNTIIYIGAVAGALAAIGLLIHSAIVRPLRKFLRNEIVGSLVDIKDAVDNLSEETSGLKQKVTDHIQDGHNHA